MSVLLAEVFDVAPGPIDSEMLDEAIATGIEESDTLDWKRDLPDEKTLAHSDAVKDIAALANSGGGFQLYAEQDLPSVRGPPHPDPGRGSS